MNRDLGCGRATTTWTKKLEQFFEARERELAGVLDARSCREGWLHGEMLRWFRRDHPTFCVNEVSIGPRKTADIACLDAPRMIGEIKILGRGYQRKVVTGAARGLKAVEKRLVQPISEQDRSAPWIGSWGLVPDYFRLRQAVTNRPHERVLILVADVTDADEDALSRVLREIRFDANRVRELRMDRGLVRIWTL